MTSAEELIGRTRDLGIQLWVSDGTLKYRAPRAAFSAELRAELQAHKSSIIDALSGPRYEHSSEAGVIEIPAAFVAPWNHVRSGAIGIGYTNVTNLVCRFRFPLDLSALERALHRVAQRHNALRCRLSEDGPGLCLIFDCTPELTVVDLSECELTEVGRAIIKTAQEISWRPFAPGACLFKPFMFKLPAPQVAIGFVVHHFIVDGWSFGQVPTYWMMEYERQLRQQPEEEESPGSLQYSDYLLGVARWSKSLNFQRRRDYWVETLRGAVSSRLLPDRAVDDDAKSFHGSLPIHIDSERVKLLTGLAAACGVTLSDVLLAGVAIAMQRELGMSDICLRHLWHGRDDPSLFDMIGSTVNPIILRIRLNPESRLRDVAQQVHRVALEAFENHVPFYYVDRILNETGTSGFVQTNFQLGESAGTRAGESALASSEIDPIPIWNPDQAFATPGYLQAHDVNLSIAGGTVWGQVAYLESVYDAETIARFIDGFLAALEQ